MRNSARYYSSERGRSLPGAPRQLWTGCAGAPPTAPVVEGRKGVIISFVLIGAKDMIIFALAKESRQGSNPFSRLFLLKKKDAPVSPAVN